MNMTLFGKIRCKDAQLYQQPTRLLQKGSYTHQIINNDLVLLN